MRQREHHQRYTHQTEQSTSEELPHRLPLPVMGQESQQVCYRARNLRPDYFQIMGDGLFR
jgi:hypothetical protein